MLSWIHLHSFQAVEYDGHFFVNPGSASGAWIGAVNGCVFLTQTPNHRADLRFLNLFTVSASVVAFLRLLPFLRRASLAPRIWLTHPP